MIIKHLFEKFTRCAKVCGLFFLGVAFRVLIGWQAYENDHVRTVVPYYEFNRGCTKQLNTTVKLPILFLSLQVSPLFEAALKAINSLEIHDLEEIRSYRTPPDLVRLVVSSICLLFSVEQT